MKISNAINIIMMITISLNFADAFAYMTNTTPEPDWRKQNAQIESIEAQTAKEKADAAAKNANTVTQNPTAVTQVPTPATQVPSTATQVPSTATQVPSTATQVPSTAVQQKTTTSTTVVTPVPAPKEVVVAPTGFASCTDISAGWVNNVWIPAHRVCKYNSAKEGVAWIEGYWACIQFKATSKQSTQCTNWEWRPGRWTKTLETY